MKNPGCGKQPGFSSLRLREAILPNPATPERACGDDTQSKTAYGDDANPLSNRRALKFIHSYVSADKNETCYDFAGVYRGTRSVSSLRCRDRHAPISSSLNDCASRTGIQKEVSA